MLKEITEVKKVEGEPRRRWFTDTMLDLYVWYDDEDNIMQFQISYDKGPNEQALNWNRESGVANYSVDDGEGATFRMKSTPVIVADSEYDMDKVIHLVEQQGFKLEHDLFEFIIAALTENRAGPT